MLSRGCEGTSLPASRCGFPGSELRGYPLDLTLTYLYNPDETLILLGKPYLIPQPRRF